MNFFKWKCTIVISLIVCGWMERRFSFYILARNALLLREYNVEKKKDFNQFMWWMMINIQKFSISSLVYWILIEILCMPYIYGSGHILTRPSSYTSHSRTKASSMPICYFKIIHICFYSIILNVSCFHNVINCMMRC